MDRKREEEAREGGIRLFVTGLSGWGKSYYLAARLRERGRVILWTPWDADYPGGFVRCATYADLLEMAEEVKDRRRWRLRYSPPLFDLAKCQRLLDHFSRWSFERLEGFTFAVDEAQRYKASPRSEMPQNFYLLADEGRHKGISTVVVARRPAQITPLMRGLADEVVTFRLNSKNDVKELDDWFGDQAEAVRSLPKYHYLRYVAKDSSITVNPPVRL